MAKTSSHFSTRTSRDDGLDVLPTRVVRIQDEERALPREFVIVHSEQCVRQLSTAHHDRRSDVVEVPGEPPPTRGQVGPLCTVMILHVIPSSSSNT